MRGLLVYLWSPWTPRIQTEFRTGIRYMYTSVCSILKFFQFFVVGRMIGGLRGGGGLKNLPRVIALAVLHRQINFLIKYTDTYFKCEINRSRKFNTEISISSLGNSVSDWRYINFLKANTWPLDFGSYRGLRRWRKYGPCTVVPLSFIMTLNSLSVLSYFVSLTDYFLKTK